MESKTSAEELAKLLARFVPEPLLNEAVAAVMASESRRSYALPQTDSTSSIAVDNTTTRLPGTWIDYAIKALDDRWDRGWTGGTVSVVTVVAAAFEAAARGDDEPPLWPDENEDDGPMT
jgi:hypothetical protein